MIAPMQGSLKRLEGAIVNRGSEGMQWGYALRGA